MNTLPTMGDTSSSIPTPPQAIGNVSKEAEMVSSPSPESPLKEVGVEMELPKEVTAAGVSIRPTAIPIPPPVSKLGVKPTGQNIGANKTGAIAMVLTDEQIAEGLHVSISNSLRWLAEWCRHKLKVLHIVQ